MAMKPLIVGNWKEHKTLVESVQYVEAAAEALDQLDQVEVVLCPPFTAIAVVEGLLRGTRLRLGAQTVSAWKSGAYTGEVSAEMVAEHCQFAIIGHSERRRMCDETIEVVNSKIRRCVEVGIKPIVCVSNEAEVDGLAAVQDKQDDWIVAFEPLEAIGTGKPEDPAVVTQMAKVIRSHMGKAQVLYGGSTDANNIANYLQVADGALVGGASLDPKGFVELCRVASR